MSELYDIREAREVEEKLEMALALPPIPEGDDPYSDGECFNPWDLFPSLYGTYSSDFDEMAIAVLIDVEKGTHERTDLAAQMFREMLCTSGICTYGTSPRVCFPETEKMRDLIAKLVEKWIEYASLKWKD